MKTNTKIQNTLTKTITQRQQGNSTLLSVLHVLVIAQLMLRKQYSVVLSCCKLQWCILISIYLKYFNIIRILWKIFFSLIVKQRNVFSTLANKLIKIHTDNFIFKNELSTVNFNKKYELHGKPILFTPFAARLRRHTVGHTNWIHKKN